ncbi:diguanylate cyclase [Rhizobium sp. SSA_523]|nr:diguanylate cyclase [Rhizobium sp. SSA_523]
MFFRIFAVSFISIHVPLIALIVFLLLGFDPDRTVLFTLLLLATLAGTAACMAALWHLLRPLRSLSGAVAGYQADGLPFQMNLRRNDEVGRLAQAVTAMVAHVDTLMKELRHQATTDSLTGLGNRRWLGERIGEEQSRALRQNEDVSVILFDLDHFKDINDRYGHVVGDRVLMSVGEVVRDSIRPYDLAARVGGEEFCVILPRTTVAEAAAIAERIRAKLELSVITPLEAGRVTASFGVCDSRPGAGLHQILAAADGFLYRSKHGGRNRVSTSQSLGSSAPLLTDP